MPRGCGVGALASKEAGTGRVAASRSGRSTGPARKAPHVLTSATLTVPTRRRPQRVDRSPRVAAPSLELGDPARRLALHPWRLRHGDDAVDVGQRRLGASRTRPGDRALAQRRVAEARRARDLGARAHEVPPQGGDDERRDDDEQVRPPADDRDDGARRPRAGSPAGGQRSAPTRRVDGWRSGGGASGCTVGQPPAESVRRRGARAPTGSATVRSRLSTMLRPDALLIHSSGLTVMRCARTGTATALTSSGVT